MQPEIKFVNKLISMRKQADKRKANLKQGVMAHVMWLQRHIQANGYSNRADAKSFLRRHESRINYIMFSDKPTLIKEYFELWTKE